MSDIKMADSNVKRLIKKYPKATAFVVDVEELQSFLTTIESQSKLIEAQVDHINTINAQFEHQIKEGNSSLRDCEVESEGAESTIYELKFQIISKNLLIESQKEEIERLKSHQVIKNYTDMLVECNSLKAITELAKGCLRWYADEANYYNQAVETDDGKFARDGLAEIERLQND